jgi:hypothetical protein
MTLVNFRAPADLAGAAKAAAKARGEPLSAVLIRALAAYTGVPAGQPLADRMDGVEAAVEGLESRLARLERMDGGGNPWGALQSLTPVFTGGGVLGELHGRRAEPLHAAGGGRAAH